MLVGVCNKIETYDLHTLLLFIIIKIIFLFYFIKMTKNN